MSIGGEPQKEKSLRRGGGECEEETGEMERQVYLNGGSVMSD